jgi:arylsulfatase A-like enzyme
MGFISKVNISMKHRKPNIILIFSDQHRRCDTGCYGSTQVHTPNMDAMAKNGVIFNQAISNSPVCTPARGSLLTGNLPLKHKAIGNDLPIDVSMKSIANVFKDAGYKTGYIGKWHLDGVPRNKFTPKERRMGFDLWAAYNCHHDYFDTKFYTDTDNLVKRKGYEPQVQTDMAMDFIEKSKEVPFLLVLSYGPPHSPYEKVPEEYKKYYLVKNLNMRQNFSNHINRNIYDTKRVDYGYGSIKEHLLSVSIEGSKIDNRIEAIRNYWAQITAIDDCLGLIREKIKSLKLNDNTILVYTSDHGDMLYCHEYTGKQIWYEESIGIPLIMEWPGSLPAGYNNKKTVFGIVDISPTLCGLAGLDMGKVDGKDLSGDAEGKSISQKESMIMDIVPLDDACFQKRAFEWRGYRTDRYTFARSISKELCLFDNIDDPYQLNNLISDPRYGDIKKDLALKLDKALLKYGDDFLKWSDYIKKFEIVKEWNKRDLELHGEHAYLID